MSEVTQIISTSPYKDELMFSLQQDQSVQPQTEEPREPSAFHADLIATQRRERPVRERFTGFGSNEADFLIIEAMEHSGLLCLACYHNTSH